MLALLSCACVSQDSGGKKSHALYDAEGKNPFLYRGLQIYSGLNRGLTYTDTLGTQISHAYKKNYHHQ